MANQEHWPSNFIQAGMTLADAALYLASQSLVAPLAEGDDDAYEILHDAFRRVMAEGEVTSDATN